MAERRKHLDDIDLRIVEELERDGRISNAELARRVGLSASPCWERVRALEKSGVILGYSAIVNRAALGLLETVIVEINLERHDTETMDAFAAAVQAMPEVIEALVLAGEWDFQIKVAVADTADYERFLRTRLYSFPGIRQVKSVFLVRSLPTRRRKSVAPGR